MLHAALPPAPAPFAEVREGALSTAAPPVRHRYNPANDIIRILNDMEAQHAGVLEELSSDGDRREATINMVSARLLNEQPHLEPEIADRLVERTVDARLQGIL